MSENSRKPQCCLCLNSGTGLSYLLIDTPKTGKQYLCNRCAETIATGAEKIAIGLIKKTNLQPSTNPAPSPAKPPTIVSPKRIKTFTDDYIIGQEEAKKTLAVGIYQHYLRIGQARSSVDAKFADTTIEKSNILLVGPTGVGKTLLVKTIAKLLKVPFAIADATVFTEAGYVGEDVESILTRLLQVCDYNVELAQRGIVYIDEIDKLARRGHNPSITKDVGGEGVQQGLLKLLEGTEALVPPHGGRKHPEQSMIKINTKDILFICGGAFAGIEKIVAKRLNTNSIGFKKTVHSSSSAPRISGVTTEDLRNFGLIPELLGRLPIITQLHPLDHLSLQSILTTPRNSIVKQYQKIFALSGIQLEFHREAIAEIARIALSLQTGARGLRAIVERVLEDLIYNIGEEARKKITITAKYVKTQTHKLNLAS